MSQAIGHTSDTLRSIMLEAVKAQHSADTSLGNVSNNLLAIAYSFQGNKQGTEASTSFLAACETHEKFIKSASAGADKVEKLPRCWTQAKSNIKGALEIGLKLSEYQTESSLRKALIAARKLVATPDPVKVALADIQKLCDTMPAEKAAELAKALLAAALGAIAELVPVEPVPVAELHNAHIHAENDQRVAAQVA